jgi:alkylhydroperoxidase/carboxymuconolactone decarboxylase family protein YurZ
MTTRASLREQGEAVRHRLFGDDDGAPSFMRTLNTEASYGAIWSRPGLALPDRMLCALAALAAVQRLPKLRRHVGAALDLGLTPRAVLEVLIQIGIYAGFAASEEAVEMAAAEFASRRIAMPEETGCTDPLEQLTERGRKMEQLHGARAREGYAASGSTVTGALYPLAIQYGYGEIWFRPGLDLRQRTLVAVAAFTALKLGQVQKFGESALNMGLSRTEIIEAIIQTAPLSGFAPALNALGALSGALASSYPGVIAPRIGDTGRSLWRRRKAEPGVPARILARTSSGSYSTPIGLVANPGPFMKALASSPDSKASTCSSIWLPSGSA